MLPLTRPENRDSLATSHPLNRSNKNDPLSPKNLVPICVPSSVGVDAQKILRKKQTHIIFAPKNLAQKPMGFFPNRKISIQVTPSSTNDQLQSAQEPGFPDFPRWMMDSEISWKLDMDFPQKTQIIMQEYIIIS